MLIMLGVWIEGQYLIGHYTTLCLSITEMQVDYGDPNLGVIGVKYHTTEPHIRVVISNDLYLHPTGVEGDLERSQNYFVARKFFLNY